MDSQNPSANFGQSSQQENFSQNLNQGKLNIN